MLIAYKPALETDLGAAILTTCALGYKQTTINIQRHTKTRHSESWPQYRGVAGCPGFEKVDVVSLGVQM